MKQETTQAASRCTEQRVVMLKEITMLLKLIWWTLCFCAGTLLGIFISA